MQLTGAQIGTKSLRGVQLRAPEPSNRVPARRNLDIRSMKDIQGTVVSVQMNKTAVIQVERYVPHRLYGKRVRKTKKFFAHDEEEKAQVGDTVKIVSVPKISKNKAFKVDTIVSRENV